jgi:hypothetical protein
MWWGGLVAERMYGTVALLRGEEEKEFHRRSAIYTLFLA